ncbi:MAG: aldo/keto reductase [Acidimicrobiia bacterium]|nr:aldo/keto reductase [Acidimicrobiia bacterium]
MQERLVGGTPVSCIGLGAMMFGFVDAGHDDASVVTMHAAFDAGITLVDTALAYTDPVEERHGERIVAEAVRSSGRQVFVATKGGHWHGSDGDFPKDGRPDTIRRHCEGSLRTLGVDSIWLYQLHWPDPQVPIEETMGAFAELRAAGHIEHVGVSNFSVDQLERARSVVPVASVQNKFSIAEQEERPVVDYCVQHGIAFLAYSPLGGLLAAKGLGDVAPNAARVAEDRGLSVQQVALAWLLAQSPTIIPIPGCTRAESARSSAAAADVVLTEDELGRLG